MALNMTPHQPEFYPTYVRLAEAISRSDFALGAGISPDRQYLSFSQLTFGVFCAFSTSPLKHHVIRVVLQRAKKQVRFFAASGVVTGVQDFHSSWYRSVFTTPSIAMGSFWGFACPNAAVSTIANFGAFIKKAAILLAYKTAQKACIPISRFSMAHTPVTYHGRG